ncbi:MAG: ribulose-phosphate 3-epimerase [Gemmatimonadales bacterium]|nr:MAG: ribulose-phosphate 3-epimerase [Gemmatimonadales bacterium]
MNNQRALIAPSILSADFGRLAAQVQEAEEVGADWIHVDVMDGRFVPNLTIGPGVTAAVRKATSLPVDVHLMIVEPERLIPSFAAAGADRITVHQEVCPHLHRVVEGIREAGASPGVAINPSTPVESLREVAGLLDLILVMTVNPGFGGQRFIGGSLDKLLRLGEALDRWGVQDRPVIQVDGGIDALTAPQVVGAGAQVLVAGSALYGAPDGLSAAMTRLRTACDAAGRVKV